MKIVEAILATSHVDRQNEQLTLSALQGMVQQVNERYIPMGLEHDPRIPPQGRLISAELQELEDGEYAIRGTFEVFEPGDVVELQEGGREIALHEYSEDSICITYDRSYRASEDQELLRHAAEASNAHLQLEGKKSLEPLSILTLAGTFVLGGIAAGFLKKIGADGWDVFKDAIGKLLRRRKESGTEYLMAFEAVIPVEGHHISVEVYLSNPSEEDLRSFFGNGLSMLDHLLGPYLRASPDLRRLVLEYEGGSMLLKFGVRKDAVPMAFRTKDKSPIDDLEIKR